MLDRNINKLGLSQAKLSVKLSKDKTKIFCEFKMDFNFPHGLQKIEILVSSLVRTGLRFSASSITDFNFPHGPQKIEILKN